MITRKNLFPLITDFTNVEDAYWKASSCKHTRLEFLLFELDRYNNLVNIWQEVINGNYEIGNYFYFTVYEPKPREIMKLPARDRVVQHMWNTVMEPIFDSKFYYHSYACRSGKGMHLASATLHGWIYKECVINKKKLWAIKGDLHSYFKSIDHIILKNQVLRYIGDQKAIDLTFKFIDHNGILPNGLGIPVGNLSSQSFANIYGNILDEYVKEQLKCVYYMRYMDDFIILGENYHELETILSCIAQFVFEEMHMTLNPKTTIVYVPDGLDFIGFNHFPTHTVPRKMAYKRLERYVDLYVNGLVNEEEFILSYPSRIGHLLHCDSYMFLNMLEQQVRAVAPDDMEWYRDPETGYTDYPALAFLDKI